MKRLGIIFFCLGVVAMILTLAMDTSVEVGGGRRVHNIGLLGQQQNFLIISLSIAVTGVLLFVFGVKAKNLKGGPEKNQKATVSSDTRTCPYCAETIKSQAILCRYCGKDVIPQNQPTSTSNPKVEHVAEEMVNQSALDKISFQIGRIENYIADMIARLTAANKILPHIEVTVRKLGGLSKYTTWAGLVILVIGLGWVFYYAWIADFSYVTQLRMPEHYKSRLRFLRISESMTIIFLGVTVLYWASIIKKDRSTIYSAASLLKVQGFRNQAVLWILRRPINLLVLTAAVTLSGLVAHVSGKTDAAYIVSILALILCCLLYMGKRPFAAAAFGVVSIAYLFYWHNVVDTLAYGFEVLRNLYLNDRPLFDIWPCVWLLIASTSMPHFGILRVGEFRFGGLRGDIFCNISGHTIYFPIASVCVFYIAFSGLLTLLNRMWQLIF